MEGDAPPPPPEPPPAPPPPPPALPEDPSPSALHEAIRAGRLAEVVLALGQVPPVRRAELFLLLRLPDQKGILSAAPHDLAASILADCDSASLAPTLEAIDLAPLAPALLLIPPDNLADIVHHAPEGAKKKILDLLDPPLREEVQRLLTFDPDTAGGLMTPRYLSVPEVVTIGRAQELLRAARRPDSPSYIYIVDAYGKLVGVAPLRALLLESPRSPVRSIMVKNVTRLAAWTPREEIVRQFTQRHYVALPVVDDKDRLIGVVTFDDAIAAMRQAEQRVLRGMTGIDPREALKETWSATRGRIPWITVTILAGLGCAAIAGLFERTLKELLVLSVFMPIVLALGESVGAQTTTVVLSALAGGSITRGDVAKFVLKEVLVGVAVGIYSGAAVAATSLLWHGNPKLGLLLGGAVSISVSWAAFLAVVVPGLMRRLRVNPAIASGPLVLALADFSTLLVYFGAATAFLPSVR